MACSQLLVGQAMRLLQTPRKLEPKRLLSFDHISYLQERPLRVGFLKPRLIVNNSDISDSSCSAFKESFMKIEAVLTQQNDCSQDNKHFQPNLRKKRSNECFALERFKQEQLRLECEKTIADLIDVRTLLREQIADRYFLRWRR
jgi:hypothetical protein